MWAHSSHLYYTELQKFTLQSSTMSLLFLAVIKLLSSSNKIKFFPINTKTTDRNGINKQNTDVHHTLRERRNLKELARTKLNDTYFFNQPFHF